MITKLYLVRHGETQSNHESRYTGHTDVPLNPRGVLQARRLAERLKSMGPFDSIYASDLSRSLQTAEILDEALKVDSFNVTPKLRESHFGLWEGLTVDEIRERYPDLYERWKEDPASVRIPQGEFIRDLQRRAVEVVDEAVKGLPGKKILVVAHGGTNRAILAHYLGLSLKNFWKLRQDNTSLNLLDFYQGRSYLSLLNDTSHLTLESTVVQ